MARKKNQASTEEFRREAVKRSEKSSVTQAQVAEELGINAQQIANWKRQFTRLSDKQSTRLGLTLIKRSGRTYLSAWGVAFRGVAFG